MIAALPVIYSNTDSDADMPQSQSMVLRLILEWMDQANIPYAILGNPVKLRNPNDGDIDIVVDHASLRNLPMWFASMCQTLDLIWAITIHYQPKAVSLLIAWKADKQHAFLKLDVCSEYVFRKFRLDADVLLHNRVRHQMEYAFWTPCPESAFVYYLWKKSAKQVADEAAFQYLRTLSQQINRDQLAQAILRIWPGSATEPLVDALKCGQYDAFRHILPDYQRLFFQQTRPLYPILETLRLCKRFRYPVGVSVQFLGPDGSGKSTVINHIRTTFRSAVPRVLVCHFRPCWGRAVDAVPGDGQSNPHDQEPRTILASILKSVYYLMDFLVSYWLFIRPRLVRNAVYVLDRGFSDLLVDPGRYRMNSPKWLLSLCYQLIPRADITFVLDAPTDCLVLRKQEIPAETLDHLRQGYVKFAQRHDAVVIDASRPAEIVALEIENHVLDCMRLKRDRYWRTFQRLMPRQ